MDEAISLLKNAGMWTDRISRASTAGVQIRDLCDYDYAWPCLSVFGSVGLAMKLALHSWKEQPHRATLAVIVISLWFYHLLRILCSFEPDQRAFGCVVASKFAVLRLFQLLPIWILNVIKVTDVSARPLTQYFCLLDLCNWTVQIVLMESGIDRVAQHFGPDFAQMLLWKLNSREPDCCPEHTSSGSEDSNADSDMSFDDHSAYTKCMRDLHGPFSARV